MLKKLFTVSVVVLTITWAMGLAAFLPVASAASAGDLIKMEGLSTVYYLGDNLKRYVFPNAKTFNTWYNDYLGVITVSLTELQSYPLAGVNVVYKPGLKLVKITTDPKVYAIGANGALHWVKTEAIAAELYGANWTSSVEDLPDEFFGNYTLGTDVSAAADYDKTAQVATATNISVNQNIGTGTTTTTPVATGALTVSLASDTPLATSIPQGAANVVFAKVNLTAGSEAVTITGMKVTKYGLGANANISAVKLYNGTAMLGNSQSLNSQNQAVFTGFSLVIPANSTKTLDAAVDLAAAVTAGHLINMGVNAATDITTTASISGSFPLKGSTMTMSAVTIGTITLNEGSLHPRSDVNVQPDATDSRFTQVKMTAAGEAATVTQVTAHKNGTAASADVSNVKLVNDTTGEVLSTVASLDSSGRAVFSGLNIVIAKGSSVELSVLASLNGGSGRTLGFDLSDGATYGIMVKGGTYGFGINPTSGGALCFAGPANACQTQTISQGKLQVNKSALTPATGYVAQGGNQQAIAAWDFVVTGEPIQISALNINMVFTTMVYSEWTQVSLYNASGVVAGPIDTSSANLLAYTDTISLPIGTTTLYLKGNIATSTSALDNMQATINTPRTQITAKGVTSGKTLTATEILTAAAVAGNVMTVQAGALAVSTLATPVADSVVVNAQDLEFAYFDLNATAGGEDVRVSQIVITDTIVGVAAYADLANLELWGAPALIGSTSTDALVRLPTSNNTATNAATVTFTFSTPLHVTKSAISRIILRADVIAGTAGGTHTFSIAAAGNVTAVGWTTGNSVTPTVSGAGQAQTIRASGLLKVERASDYPDALQLVSASTGNTIMKYKLTALYETVGITDLPLYLNTDSTGVSEVASVALFLDGTQVGTNQVFLRASKVASFHFEPALVIPKGTSNSKVLSVKVNIGTRDEVTSGKYVQVGIGDSDGNNTEWGGAGNYYIVATGASSGTTITQANIDSAGDGTGNVYGGNTFYAYKGVLTVSLNSSSPSGLKTASTSMEALRFDLTATGDIITVKNIELEVNGSATGITGTSIAYLKKVTSGTVSTTTYATFAAGTGWLDPDRGDGSAPTYFSVLGDDSNGAFDTTLEIAAGSTVTLALLGDTNATTAQTNKTLQVNIAGLTDTTSGVSWYDSGLTAATAVDATLTKNLPLSGGNIYF